MRAFFAFFRMRFRALLQYRAAAISGILTQWAFGMVRVMALLAFYESSDAVQPLSMAQTVTYIWITQAVLGILPWNVDEEISTTIRTGQVAYELARPQDIYSMWFARSLAKRTAPTLLRAVPQFIIALFIIPAPYKMLMPAFGAFCAWLICILGACVLAAAITNFLHTLLFITTIGDGLMRFVPTLVSFFSGAIIPLELMPDGSEIFFMLQPMSGVLDMPARIFCGTLAPSKFWLVLILQAFWTVIFILWGRAMIKRGVRRVCVAGG